MRLIYVSHSFPPAKEPLANIGGMQRVATELHKALYRHDGIAIETVVLRSKWSWTHIKTPFFLISAWLQLRRAIRQGHADVILFSSMVTATLAVPLRHLADEYGVRLASISHGRDVTLPVKPYQWLVPRVFHCLDAAFPVSSATRAACIERGMAPEDIHVIPNGVDLNRFHRPDAQRREAREQLLRSNGTLPAFRSDDEFILFSVGRQVKRKGFEWFIRNVMPLLPESVHYWLAGDGPEEESIQEAIDESGLSRRVRLMGQVSEKELDGLYHGTDLFVMPNIPIKGDMEGFGIVMLEAGQCGLPTVASRIEGITDVIKEGQNGHLVDYNDPGAFASTIQRYVENRTLLNEASDRAAAYVRQTFNWTKVGERYVAALESLTSQSTPEPARSGQ